MQMQRIDPDFDFYCETPAGGDPDACSPTLKLYHKLLWSKPLPSGDRFDLDDAAFGRFPYLRHESALGTFELSSDGMIATFHYYKRQSVRQLMDQLPHGFAKQFHDDVCNIGGYILFPKNKVPGVHSINQARGCHPQLSDRFDLALECIRRHYLGEGSPLADVLSRHSDFFDLFGGFKGYVEFFLLQDFTNADCTAVRFWTDDFDNFTAPPIPQTVKAYLEYARRAGAACRARAGRMVQAHIDSLPDKQVIELNWKQFGAGISPPIEYTRGYPFEECVMLARKALRTGRAIPWYTMFTPLPPGALS